MISLEETILRLALGAFIGGVIGFEREVHGRAAGFRTQLIVCVAAVLIMIISENYYLKLEHIDDSFRIDPARLASGALIGIGFLGAGVIIKSGFTVRGLTTAATIWIVSAIGLAIGGGFYIAAIFTSLITIMALVVLRKVEKSVKILSYKSIIVSTGITDTAEGLITSLLRDHGLHIHSIDYEKDPAADELVYTYRISTRNKNAMGDIFIKINALDFVKYVKIDGGDSVLL
jgi:putative Mg2+ transporter-C (MgtC) family protein